MEKRRHIRLKLGRSLRPSLEENCLTCALWPICTDKSKSSGYLCSRFREADGERFDLDRMVAESAQDREDTIQPWEPKTSDDDANFDVEKYVLDIVKNSGSMPDMSIDDGDFPQAKNFYEFTCSKMYQNMKPFGRQFEIAVNLMSEYCPYCTDMKWLDGTVSVKTKIPAYLEHVVLLENGICPQCDARKSEMVGEGDLNDHYEMAGLAGQRGGKSAVTGMVTSYTNHLFLKLPSPSQFFGLLKNQQLGATFLATTQDQARKTIWDPIYQALSEGPWYVNYHKMLDHWHEKTGIEYYSLKDTYYWYRHRNLIGSVSGPNMRTLRGLTRYLGGIDEIGWFTGNDGAVKLNADEVHKAMRRSFLTLRAAHASLRKKGMNSIPAPMFLNISSPSSRYDKITKLYNQSKKSRMVYGFRFATWEMNPKVSRKVLAEEFAENYEKAMRDYGAKPPLSSAGFIGDINFVKKCLDPHRENMLKIKQVLVQTRANAVMTSGKAKIISPGTKTNHILTFDAGETHNSFAFCVAHNDKALSPVIDAIGEVIPQKNHRINFRDVYDRILLPLIDEFNVIMAVTDRWQSKKILMDIETDRRVDTREYTVKYEDFEMLREDIHDATISFPRCEIKIPEILDLIDESYPKSFEGKPVAHLIAQIMTVRDFETSVEKGESTTDDIFRAVVLAHSFLRDKDLAPKFAGETARRFGSFGFIGSAGGVQSVSRMGAMVSGSSTGGARSANGVGASKTM